jgi:hypothetical protein
MGSLVTAAVVVRNILPPEAEGLLHVMLGRVAAAFIQPPDTIMIHETDGNGVPNKLYDALPSLGSLHAPPQSARCAALRGIVVEVPHHGRHVSRRLRDADITTARRWVLRRHHVLRFQPAPWIHVVGPTATVSGPLHKTKIPTQKDTKSAEKGPDMPRGRAKYAQRKAPICHTWDLEKDGSIGYLLCGALHLLASYLMVNLEKELFIVGESDRGSPLSHAISVGYEAFVHALQ